MRPVLMLLAILAILATPISFSSRAVFAEDCQFVLGFKTLHDLIPDIVGSCLVNEHFNPQNGDSLQETTGTRTDGGYGGLLVWRKSDNFTAFTDGFRTWVNGPFGLQRRLNSERFFWERNPEGLPITPPPVEGDRCHTAGLSLALEATDAGAGNVVATFGFTNNLDVSCTFFGFPGAQLLDDLSNPLPTNVVRGGGFLTNEPGPSLVIVPPGGSAIFRMHWGQVPVGTETICPTASQLLVTPPDEFDSLALPITITACGGGRLNVSAIQPPS